MRTLNFGIYTLRPYERGIRETWASTATGRIRDKVTGCMGDKVKEPCLSHDGMAA
jgi:hypothetical protein